jgi:hypothetical protein
MKPLTPTEQSVIDYIISENEETETSNPVTPYMRALNSEFEPAMPFTLHLEIQNLILYVQDGAFVYNTLKEFNAGCGDIKQSLCSIAEFIRYLVQEEYLRSIYKNPTALIFPVDVLDRWMQYTDFTVSEKEVLLFTCSFRVVPRLKLYKSWETMHQPYSLQDVI